MDRPKGNALTILLCGDVMIGRGIDQVLMHPGDPTLHEDYIKDARRYVELAERTNGAVPRASSPGHVWGAARSLMEEADARIINLETSITTSADHWKGKAVHYRMNPANIDVLTVAGIDMCCLANNHVLDWGYAGLEDTLATLRRSGIAATGAGMDLREAQAPAIKEVRGKGRLILFSCGLTTSGIPSSWAAAEGRPGVWLLDDDTKAAIQRIGKGIADVRRAGDIVVLSVHWGPNWGYDIGSEEIELAHGLIAAGADVIHGHSSHHVKGIEVWRGRPILYGCGDLLNDYEGIPAYEGIRSDLGLLYFASLDTDTGRMRALRMAPTRIRNLRINRAPTADALLLADILRREGERFGTGAEQGENDLLQLRWPPDR